MKTQTEDYGWLKEIPSVLLERWERINCPGASVAELVEKEKCATHILCRNNLFMFWGLWSILMTLVISTASLSIWRDSWPGFLVVIALSIVGPIVLALIANQSRTRHRSTQIDCRTTLGKLENDVATLIPKDEICDRGLTNCLTDSLIKERLVSLASRVLTFEAAVNRLRLDLSCCVQDLRVEIGDLEYWHSQFETMWNTVKTNFGLFPELKKVDVYALAKKRFDK